MNNIPCKNCICFAICNAKVKKLNGVYKTQFIIRKLENCSLFSNWVYKSRTNSPYQTLYPVSTMREFANLFKIKYDIEPDYHLVRNSYLGYDYNNKDNK